MKSKVTRKFNYSIDFFLRKFRRIPASKIGKGNLEQHCALWHCGVRDCDTPTGDYRMTPQAQALADLIGGGSASGVYTINDESKTGPKHGIISALIAAKRKLQIIVPQEDSESQYRSSIGLC